MSAPNSTGMSDAADPPEASARGGQHRRLARSTLIFSVATGLSRVAGLIREVVAAAYFGTAGPAGAFTLAFLACFDPGSRVGVIEPGYPCYRNTLMALGCEPVPIPVGPSTRWAPTCCRSSPCATAGHP